MDLNVFKNNKGSAYVFVVIIMFTVFLMLTLVLSSTRYEAMASGAYMKSLGMYQLSESGVYRSVQCIREILLANKDEIESLNEAAVFVKEELLIIGSNDYFDFIDFSIHTLEREGTAVEYSVSTMIKAEPGVGAPKFTVISSARVKDSYTEVRVKGSISLLSDEDGVIYPQLDLLRQVN